MTRIRGAWMDHPGTRAVFRALENGGYQALFVGGCVRDALLDRPVGDIDIATDARPEIVTELAESSDIKVVPTGIAHGTVTLVAKGRGHEVTTFRRDVETDGRHAVVQFSDAVGEDAARRDFTMNALYATATGEVIDPLEGLPDLHAWRVRFVGDPVARITEDALRSLRYFRFHAWYGDPQAGMDSDALSAIAATADTVANLSRERIGQEMRKLLNAPDPAPAVAVMAISGVLGHVLPGAEDRALAPLVHLEGGRPPDPMRRLAALGGTDPVADLRLSKAESKALATLREGVQNAMSPEELGYRFGAEQGENILLLRGAMLETPTCADDFAAVRRGAVATFPVKPGDLMPQYSGAALGVRMRELEARWIASGFALTRAALCAEGDG